MKTTRAEILKEVSGKLGIEQWNDMQIAALDEKIENRDVVLLSPTGSGKTLAYLLPLLFRLTDKTLLPQALILVPSRELALQVDATFKGMTTHWKSCCCYGGHPINEEKKTILNQHPALIIGTPGRIGDHLRKGNFSASHIETLVIDEFDKSLELGFQDEMEEIIVQLSGLKKRLLLSATDMEEIPSFTSLVNPVKLNFLLNQDDERIQQFIVKSPVPDKIETLYNLLCLIGSKTSIVFCNHRDAVDRVYKLLKEKNVYCESFHGGMEQKDRERALYKFNNGSAYTLISTDLASRGLDIPQVEHIIHYHIPINEETFVHRNGRSTRWERKGNSYLILNEHDTFPEYISKDTQEQLLPSDMLPPAKPLWTTLYIGKGKRDNINKIDVVGFLYKKGKLSHEDVGKVEVRERYSFVAVRTPKLKQMMNLVQGEKIKGTKTIIEAAK